MRAGGRASSTEWGRVVWPSAAGLRACFVFRFLRGLRFRGRCVSMSRGPAPLLDEVGLVPLERLTVVDAVAEERAASEVVDEDVLRDDELPAGAHGAHAEVVVLEGPEAEPLVEEADVAEDLGARQEAEPGEAPRLLRVATPLAGRPARVRGHIDEAVVASRGIELRAAHVVRDGPDQADARVAVEVPRKAGEPSLDDHDVVVEEKDPVSGRGADPLVRG